MPKDGSVAWSASNILGSANTSNRPAGTKDDAIYCGAERVKLLEVADLSGYFEIGVVPYGRRFAFRTQPLNELISRKVAESFSGAYLERIHQEQLVGGARKLC